MHVKKDFDLIDEQADEYLNVAPICLPRFDDQDFLTGKNKGQAVMKILIKYPAFEYLPMFFFIHILMGKRNPRSEFL